MHLPTSRRGVWSVWGAGGGGRGKGKEGCSERNQVGCVIDNDETVTSSKKQLQTLLTIKRAKQLTKPYPLELHISTAVLRKVVQQKRLRQCRKVLRVMGFLVID